MIKIPFKIFSNPYIAYTLIWTLATIFYLFGWSNLFPDLSPALIIFLIAAILAHLGFGYIIYKSRALACKPLSAAAISIKSYLFALNFFIWMLNFAYDGIPLIKIALGNNIDYREFGIPTLIVFAMSLNSFLCVYFYHIFLTTKSKKSLLYVAVGFSYFILIFSRGLILMTGMSMFFLWMSFKSTYIRLKFVFTFTLVAIAVMYFFGVAGNVRMSQLIASETNSKVADYSSQAILTVGAASEKFTNSVVPDEFFWAYIYIASPMSNLQYNINNSENKGPSLPGIIAFGVNELTYDFISKRLNTTLHITPRKPLLIVEELTVSTIFASGYRYLGWAGIICLLICLLFLPVAYIFLLGFKNEFIPIGVAVLTSIYFFSFFDNMLTYSGLGLQLVYPFLLKFISALNSKKLILSNANG